MLSEEAIWSEAKSASGNLIGQQLLAGVSNYFIQLVKG